MLREAQGVSLGKDGGNGKGRSGRSLSYVATVQGNGNLLVGKAYSTLLDLNPGDEFEIKLGLDYPARSAQGRLAA